MNGKKFAQAIIFILLCGALIILMGLRFLDSAAAPAATPQPAPESPAAWTPAVTSEMAPPAPVPTEAQSAPEPTAEPTPEPTMDPDSPAGRALAVGLPAPPDIDIDSWEFLLVNKYNTIPESFEPELANASITGSSTPQDARIVEPLEAFAQAALDEGLPVYLSSGYRSYAEQNYLLNLRLQRGESYDYAVTIVAAPGTSEHQTGLACDITDIYRNPKGKELENTATFQWMSQHCQDYGFIVRYPADKSGSADSVTGIIYEPWHFRYVGVEAARYIMENHLCLEEFVALYRDIYTAENPPPES